MALSSNRSSNRNRSKKGKIIKIVIISVVVIALGTAGVFVARKLVSGNSAEETTYKVRQETYENVIEISGNIAAANSQTLQAAGSGTVQAVYVKEGDRVKKGQVIMELDSTEQQYNLAKLDYDIAQKKISGSKRELELLQTQREMLVSKLDERKVVAYFDGIIAKLSVAPGDYLNAKDAVGTLIDRSYMTASVEIVETDVAKLSIGQTVHFTFPAYSKGTVDGYVVSYPAVGTVTNRGATVVNAEVRIDNPPNEILPNYSFTGKIEIAASVTVVIVERQAIGYDNGNAYVEVINADGTTTQRNVSVEAYGTQYVNILSGVRPGETLKSLGNVSGSLRAGTSSGGGWGGGSRSSGGGMSFGMGGMGR
ncbi:MAG: efflux RND transporter periplasmic adaptor subunit [Treponemataceae bacterium]|nr:efflux RND transporter periplasmic adaptor subunit [Treponemataceae bacterium]